MRRVDLEQVKKDWFIDLGEYIWRQTIMNNLPRRLRDAVEYLTQFAGRKLRGTFLYDNKINNGTNNDASGNTDVQKS